jgi:ketosteroid isomerase-like protein
MASEQCEKSMRSFFDTLQASRPDELREYFTEDVRWWLPNSIQLAGRGERCKSGREPVVDIVGHVDRNFKEVAYTFDHLLEDGDLVAVHATARGVRRPDIPYENEYVFLFRMADGRIAEVWELLDTAIIFSGLTEK